jgi:hypothetical protein
MKALKRIITVTVVIFFYSFSDAQRIQFTSQQYDAMHKQDIKNSPYIFEGNVIEVSTINQEGITCFTIQITKIFRGSPEIRLGTVKVLITQTENTDDGGPFLSKGCIYIIFGKIYNSTLFESITTDNSLKLTYTDPIDFYGKEGAIWDNINYHSRDSVYSFFKANGLTVQEEQK